MPQTAQSMALPVLAPGVSVALLRRVWNATPTDRKQQRATLLDSVVTVRAGRHVFAKPLRDLTLPEVERAIGAIAPRFVVRWYENGKSGIQVATFVVRADADKFAEGKQLYGKPTTVKELGL